MGGGHGTLACFVSWNLESELGVGGPPQQTKPIAGSKALPLSPRRSARDAALPHPSLPEIPGQTWPLLSPQTLCSWLCSQQSEGRVGLRAETVLCVASAARAGLL